MLIKLTQTGKNAQKKKPITNPWRYHLIFHYLFSNFPSLFRSFHSNGKYYTYYHILYMHTEYDTYLCFSVSPPPLSASQALDVYKYTWTPLLYSLLGHIVWMLWNLPEQYPLGGYQLVFNLSDRTLSSFLIAGSFPTRNTQKDLSSSCLMSPLK